MIFNFSKYEGTGNDFVLIDDRAHTFPVNDSSLIRKMCDRHFGIGADGLILLQNHPSLDFNMVYFNADGKEGSLCGNGGRCITAFANKEGMISDKASFNAKDGKHQAIIQNDDIIRLKMNDIKNIESNKDYWIMDTGSPHIVLIKESLSEMNIVQEARQIRNNERFEKSGININYLQLSNGISKMRTYERGVEDETLSCGTGTVAVAVVIGLLDPTWKSNDWINIDAPGGTLAVRIKELSKNSAKEIWLKGPTKLVFEGCFSL